MIPYLDWFLFVINVLYTYFMSRGKKIGLWFLLGVQPLWMLYGYQKESTGIIALSVFFIIIAINGLLKWNKKEH